LSRWAAMGCRARPSGSLTIPRCDVPRVFRTHRGRFSNGTSGKTVLTDVGAVDLVVPWDRNGSFEPQIVRKGQTRLEGFNDRIIALYARGMTTRDIKAHLCEMYDVDVSPDLISRVTDGVVEELAEWQSRSLYAVYPVIFVDALMIKVRDGGHQPAGLPAIGIDCEGAKPSAPTPPIWPGAARITCSLSSATWPVRPAHFSALAGRSQSPISPASAATAARNAAPSRSPPWPPGLAFPTPPRPSRSSAASAGRGKEMVPRNLLRGHLADRHPGQPCRARRHHPRPLGHRGPPALGPRHGLGRRPLPDPHRQRPPHHVQPAQHRHHHPVPDRGGQHRRRPALSGPAAQPAPPDDHELLHDSGSRPAGCKNEGPLPAARLAGQRLACHRRMSKSPTFTSGFRSNI